jgi:hypothetical protein
VGLLYIRGMAFGGTTVYKRGGFWCEYCIQCIRGLAFGVTTVYKRGGFWWVYCI